MSANVDSRIVEMKFDNRQFEQNIANTMSSLDKLKQKLNFSGATKGLETIDYAAKRVDMTTLSSAVEKVHARFSALEVMGVTALANISNAAVNAGKKIASALTVDPIKTGFSEYETQIGAVQTILANTKSKGTTLTDVNRALDELNLYADKTIYNFTEMTRNIGTFTAAGVDLDTSVSAIKGIANLAAVSGSTSQQASTAMYQLSQALSSGTVKLMDWNSVVNAGMGGQVFQDSLKETARLHGVAIDNMIDNEGSFRETLKNGWLTSEILTETLAKFTGDLDAAALKKQGYTDEQIKEIIELGEMANDAATKVKTLTQLWDTLKEAAQSGWSQSWEIIVGDFEESKEFFTKISDTIGGIIGDSANKRNELLSGGLSSGWKQLLNEGIADEEGYKEAIKKVAKENGVNFDKMAKDGESFEQTLSRALKSGKIDSDMLSKSLNNLTNDISKMSDEELKAAGYTTEQVKALKKLNDSVRTGSISMDDFAEKMKKASGRQNLIDALSNAFDGLMSVVKPIKKAFDEMFPAITAGQLYSLTESIKLFTEKLTISDKTSAKLKRTFKGLFAILDIGKKMVKAIWDNVTGLSGSMGGLVGDILDVTATIGDWLVKLNKTIESSNVFHKTLETLIGFVKSAFGAAVNTVKGFVDGFNAVRTIFREGINTSGFDALHNVLSLIYDSVTNVSEAASGLKKAIAYSISGINWEPILNIIQSVLDAVDALFSMVVDTLKQGDIQGALDIVNAGLFGGLLKSLTDFTNGVSDALDNIVGVPNAVASTLDALKDVLKAYTTEIKVSSLKNVATAMLMLAGALFIIAMIDSKKLKSAIGSMAAMIGELMAAMKFLSMSVLGKKKAISFGSFMQMILLMEGMAVAVLILAAAVAKIASVDIAKMYAATGVIAILMGILIGAAKIMSEATDVFGAKFVQGAGQMLVMALALRVLADAIVIVGSLKWDQAAVGVGALTFVLYALVGAAKIMSGNEFDDFVKDAGQLLVMAIALRVLASAISVVGKLSWDQAAVGVGALTFVLYALVGAAKILSTDGKKMVQGAGQMLVMALALSMLAVALRIVGSMHWENLIRGVVGLVVVLTALVAAAKILQHGDNCVQGAGQILVMAMSLTVLAGVLRIIGGMDWVSLLKGAVGIAGVLGILVGALAIMGHVKGDIVASAGSIVIMAGALAILTPILGFLGAMSWESIVKGLVAIAGAFVILGVAGYALASVAGTILAICGSMALLGASIALIGVGTMALGAGLASIAAGILALIAVLPGGLLVIIEGIKSVILSVIDIIPEIMNRLGNVLTSICDFIIKGAPSIAKAVGTVIVEIVKFLVDNVPILVDGILELVTKLLASLVKYTPTIVGHVFDFLIGILNGIASKMPDLIKAAVNVIMSLFIGVSEALRSIDPQVLLDGLLSVGVLAALMGVLGATVSLIPSAMVGVIGLGIVIAELALVFAAIGALAQIPGLTWLIGEGAELMMSIGNVIGAFIGGIVGGIAAGATSMLPQIGNDLALFMQNAKPFIEGAKTIDASVIDSVKALAEVILILTAAKIVDRLTSLFSGESSLVKFGEELAAFGPNFRKYCNAVSGIDGKAVEASANAAKALSEMADALPKKGGLAAMFAGENSLTEFAIELTKFGPALKKYAKSVDGLDAGVVENSVKAAKALSEMADNLPNQGGLAAWFAGDNTLATFAEELSKFGPALKKYADGVKGLDAGIVKKSANAALALAELADALPNQNGMVTWFVGDNTLSTFAEELSAFGPKLKEYAKSVDGLDSDLVINSANAAMALAELAANLPEQGNAIANWFKGKTTLSSFADELTKFGPHLKAYADSISGLDSDVVVASANAVKAIAEIASNLPEKGNSIANWFTGKTTLSSFAEDLSDFGPKLLEYAKSVKGLDSEVVIGSANAAKALAELANNLPDNNNKVVNWFTGEHTLSSFADDLISFGPKLLQYANSVSGMNTEVVSGSAKAALALAELANNLPENKNKIANWFSGENTLSSFADDLILFGPKFKAYADSIAGLDATAVTNTGNAALVMAELANKLPDNSNKIANWFTGDHTLTSFAKDLQGFGTAFASYATSVAGVDESAATKAANISKAVVSLAETANKLPDNKNKIANWFKGDYTLSEFAGELCSFGPKIVDFAGSVAGLDESNVTSSENAAKILYSVINSLPDADKAAGWFTGDVSLSEFANSLVDFGPKLKKYADSVAGIKLEDINNSITAVQKLCQASKETYGTEFKNLGDSAVTSLVKVFTDSTETVQNAASKMIDNVITGINKKKGKIAEAIKTLLAEIPDTIEGKYKSFVTIGKTITTKIGDGIKDSETVETVLTNVGNLIDDVIDAIEGEWLEFYSAGKYSVTGFADGITAQTWEAEAAAASMADDAYKAAKKKLDVNSPSKVFRKLGYSIPEGLVAGIVKLGGMVKGSAIDMADAAIDGAKDAISRIAEVVNSDIDSQPTIRPVLDLSDVTSGANTINRMLSMNPSMGVMSNVRSISSMMNRRQNGANDDVVSAIKDLKSALGNISGDTYSINGITYDDGSNITNAVQTLVRAVKIERRT